MLNLCFLRIIFSNRSWGQSFLGHNLNNTNYSSVTKMEYSVDKTKIPNVLIDSKIAGIGTLLHDW